MKIINQIDLWNDHKPSQTIDPFIIDYFDPKVGTFTYDEVIIAPDLYGNYLMSIKGKPLKISYSPEFNGGIIFLKDGKPIRLFLYHVNKSVTETNGGRKYGTLQISTTLNSKVVGTNKTLSELLHDADVKVSVDDTIRSRYCSRVEGYSEKTDPAFESADNMTVLTGPTFLNDVKDWEIINYYPDVTSTLEVISSDFTIHIEQKGLIAGIKKNQSNLRPELQGRKAYAIMLQTADQKEYKKMVDFTKEFVKQVKEQTPEELTSVIPLDNALLENE